MKVPEITKFLKLPFQFDTTQLNNDLDAIRAANWIPHFNQEGYHGEWKAIPLYSFNGDATNIFAFSGKDLNVLETPIMKECPYIRELLGNFKFPLLSVRLLRLGSGAEIKPHRDYELGYEDGNFRLHVPIVTNENVHFILGGERLAMRPGECWYTNVNIEHSVKNLGKSDRIHLVIDGKRNEWSDQLFFSLAPKESFRPIPKEPDSPETIQQIIRELERNNEPASEQLIRELKKKLKLS